MWNDARWCDEQTVDSNVKFVFSDVIRESFLLRLNKIEFKSHYHKHVLYIYASFIRLSDKYYSCILIKTPNVYVPLGDCVEYVFFSTACLSVWLGQKIKPKSYMYVYIYSTSTRQDNWGMTKNMLLNWIKNIEAGVDRETKIKTRSTFYNKWTHMFNTYR